MSVIPRERAPRGPDRQKDEARQIAAMSAASRSAGGNEVATWSPVDRLRSLIPRRWRLTGQEQRSISSVPWSVGGTLGPTSTPSVEQALRLAPVYAAANMLAKSIASLPLHGYRQVGDEKVQMPSLPQLFQEPSVQGTLWDWIYRCITSLALTGNAYGLVTARDGFGFPTMMEWLNPKDVQIHDRALSGRGSFMDPIFLWFGVQVPREQIVHIPWFTVPGRVTGLSPIASYSNSVQTGLSAQDFSKNWFEAGGVPPGTFQNTSQTVTDAEGDEIKARLVKAIRSGQPIVYGADWDYKPIAVNPSDSKIIEQSKMSATDIAVCYDLPPERIGGETGRSQTYSSTEQDSIRMIQFALLPYISKLEAVFYKILPERQYVKFNADYLVRTDLATRHRIYQTDRQIGLKNIDELRALEDMPPLPNGQGKDYTPLMPGPPPGQAAPKPAPGPTSGNQPPNDGGGAGQHPLPGRPPGPSATTGNGASQRAEQQTLFAPAALAELIGREQGPQERNGHH